jgi:hypothetical protein
MTVRLARQWYWSSIVVSDRYDRPMINNYSLRMEFATDTQDNQEHNIAYGRMKFWFHEIMEASVLISQDSNKIKSWQDTGSRVLVFPEDPVDQLVGMMLYAKITAITQGKIMIDQISIASPLDDDVIYHHYAEETLGPFENPGWWSDPRPIWQTKPSRGKGKVISLDRPPDWKDHGLEWDVEHDNSVVVMGSSITDED